MYFLVQYNAYFYCMVMLRICLITLLATFTKKKKIQTIEKKITPSMPLNDSTNPNKESNDKDTFSYFNEITSNMNKVISLIQIFLDLYNYKYYD